MNEALELSPAGRALIQGFEACMHGVGPDRFKAYTCPAGVLTIGWGHTNASRRAVFGAADVWSSAQCDAAFTGDLQGVQADVRRLVKVALSQGQFDALVSFAYNCGASSLAGSTLLVLLNKGDYDGAALEFHKWSRGGGKVLPGLVRRRAAEAMMFQDATPEGGVPESLIAPATLATRRIVEPSGSGLA